MHQRKISRLFVWKKATIRNRLMLCSKIRHKTTRKLTIRRAIVPQSPKSNHSNSKKPRDYLWKFSVFVRVAAWAIVVEGVQLMYMFELQRTCPTLIVTLWFHVQEPSKEAVWTASMIINYCIAEQTAALTIVILDRQHTLGRSISDWTRSAMSAQREHIQQNFTRSLFALNT